MVANLSELWFNIVMQKQKAIEILGGTITLAAKALKISYQAIDHWPDPLPDRVADRVVAYVARKKFPDLLDSHGITVAPPQPERRKADLEAEPVEGMQMESRSAADKLAAKTAGVI